MGVRHFSVSWLPYVDRIEKTIIDKLTELAFKRKVLTAIIDEAKADVPRLKKELKARQNLLLIVSDRIRTLIYSHAEVDGDAQKLIAEELGKHSKRKVELETSIAGLEGRIAGCSSNRVVTEAVVAVLDRFTSSIRVLNPLERKNCWNRFWQKSIGMEKMVCASECMVIMHLERQKCYPEIKSLLGDTLGAPFRYPLEILSR
jgi:hypothetical protein